MKDAIWEVFELKSKAKGYWAERILSELEYALAVSNAKNGCYDSLITKTAGFLLESFGNEGILTASTAQKAENMLLEISQDAKNCKIIFAAHAHIDMNWLWGYAETVAITLDTFRTMLNLMKEYPEYKFSQSQASVYRIVEEFDPEMLKEIKQRIKEGRWEVTACNWVEPDKNLPNGESLSRHILYTKRYLSSLLEIDPDSLTLDFEPDSFGHNINVPEILSNGGVKYYYHCRGYEGHNIYRWQSPSGRSVIAYRDPFTYNLEITSDMAFCVPEFCQKNGVDAMLLVYGVGDHGGGPTRMDIEKLLDMAKWPVFPTIKLGTYGEYFKRLECISENLPIVDKELNFVFDGCYTTQTRIKLANRVSENKLNEAEAFSALTVSLTGGVYPRSVFEEAWRKVLFNHFHDILPGSGIIDTREFALGQFQQVLAVTNTEISKSIRAIAAQVDTSELFALEEDVAETVSEGAGAGYSIKDFGVPQIERGRGKNRIFHFFNPSAHDRHEAVEITLWDWPGNRDRLQVKTAVGSLVKHQIIDDENPSIYMRPGFYWGHNFMKLLVEVWIPANGYNTYVLCESSGDRFGPNYIENYPRIDKVKSYVLENDNIRVEFDSMNASIKSLYDKRKKRELIDAAKPAAIFRLIEEDDAGGETAWRIGRYMKIRSLTDCVKIKSVSIDIDALRQNLTYEIEFGASNLSVAVSLYKNSSILDFHVKCEWLETSVMMGKTEIKQNIVRGRKIPQLNFHLPFAYKCSSYKYDIPFGTIIRDALDMDVPANSWALAIPEESNTSSIMVVTDSKYGFRGVNDSLSVTLIRSSYDPDPHPELGIHEFRLGIHVATDVEDNTGLVNKAYEFCHPIHFVSGTRHKGVLPLSMSFMSVVKGSAIVAAVKMIEEECSGNKLIIRVYETSGADSNTCINFTRKVAKAYFVDINENADVSGSCCVIGDSNIEFKLKLWSMASICVEFA